MADLPSFPRVHAIQAFVAYRLGFTTIELLSQRRSADLCRARQAAMWLARHASECSLPQLGRAFKRDHTTVLHGVAVTEARMAADSEFAALVWGLLAEIDGETSRQLQHIRRAAA